MNVIIEADKIAELTQDAYSRGRYTDSAWRLIPRELLRAGATPAEATWVLNSKHMRYAADNAGRSHSATRNDFMEYATRFAGGWTGLVEAARKALAPAKVNKGSNAADIVGYLEGEELAQAVAFVMTVATETASTGDPREDQAQLDILRDKATKLAQFLQARAAGRM